MDFSPSPKARDYVQRLSAVMQEQVLPAEPEYCAQLQNVPDWRRWKQPPVMETLKANARTAGSQSPPGGSVLDLFCDLFAAPQDSEDEAGADKP